MGLRASRDYIPAFGAYLGNELGLQPNTISTHTKSLRRGERLTGRPAHKIAPDDLRAIKRLDIPRFSDATKEATIVAYHGFHDWAELEGLPWANRGIGKVRVPRRRRSVQPSVTREEAATLLRSCIKPLEYRLIYPGLLQGTRVGESASLDAFCRLGDVLRFTVKGGHQIEVPIHPLVAQCWDRIIAKGPVSDERLHQVRRAMTKRTGVFFTPHYLRRRFAREHEDSDVPEEVIGELMGHARSTTGHYTGGVSMRRMRTAQEGLDYFRGGGLAIVIGRGWGG